MAIATKSILSVNPYECLETLLNVVVGGEGYNLSSARSLKEASALLAKVRFDLIVTEAFDQNEFFDFDPSFIDVIKSLANNTPIILFSSYVDDARIHAGDFGLAEVIRKPCDIDDLLRRVNKVLGRTVKNSICED